MSPVSTRISPITPTDSFLSRPPSSGKCDDLSSQWVYATALEALQDADTGDEVAATGSRVMLVYPMDGETSDGKVRMRLKTAHAITGQLTYRWVVVHDPEKDHRILHHFSVLP